MATEDYALATGSGALSGAATGAAVGTALGGPLLGTAAGAVVGGVLGYFGQSQADRQAEEADKLARKQARRQKNLAAKARSVERRSAAQETETVARQFKDTGTLAPPTTPTGTEYALISNISIGTGSPFDGYIMRTYGRPPSDMS